MITKLKYKGFEQYLKEKSNNGLGNYFDKKGYRWYFEFPNGYGVSVIKCFGSYGYEQDLFEIGTMYKGRLTKIKGMTESNEVIGYLNNEEVLSVLEKIQLMKQKRRKENGNKNQ